MTAFADQLWEDAATPLNDEFFGTSVIYLRKTEQSLPITAIGQTTSYSLTDSEGTVRIIAGRDYTLAVSTLIVNGLLVTPVKGDRIRETIGGSEHIYELLALDNKPAAELLPGGFRWLLHMKRVS